MHTLDNNAQQASRRRKGQTLAEFALTLPILLILMFGIIEFARIFQAWVTLQNAARAAARYASVGQYDEAKYPMILDFTSSVQSDPTGFIPCVDDGPEPVRTFDGDGLAPSIDRRGTKVDFYPNNPLSASDRMEIYTGGLESVFASWYDGINCDPRSDVHQEMRKDMARIVSIMDEARRGAAGLLLEESHLDIPADKTSIVDWPFADVWYRPVGGTGMRRSDQRSWFNVLVCSSRPRLDPQFSGMYLMTVPVGGGPREVETRFFTYGGEADGTLVHNDGFNTPFDAPNPSCVLNELPSAEALNGGATVNAGKPWLDAGGPANTVTVIITFNHPLVTPLGLTNYITIQARRSAIVESFRAAQAVQVLQPVGPVSGLPASDTPVPTATSTNTNTPLPPTSTQAPPTATATETPILPFDCNLLSAGNLRLSSRRVSFDIQNDNGKPTVMTRLIFGWTTIGAFPNMNVYEMNMDGNPFWRGADYNPTTDTHADPSTPPNYFDSTAETDRRVDALSTGTINSLFTNGPGSWADYLTIYNFGGTQIYLQNPDTLDNCIVPLIVPEPTDIPPDAPPTDTPTITYTPNCASDQMQVRFSRFEQFGVVRMEVINNRYAVGPWTDFEIFWRKWSGAISLARVTAVAPLGEPGAVTVWD
ncbi:MAG: pilus assembly protein, partial [Anaerolineae bacterium]|nr:pilus assembly protein [Anaerolineae bacterium]